MGLRSLQSAVWRYFGDNESLRLNYYCILLVKVLMIYSVKKSVKKKYFADSDPKIVIHSPSAQYYLLF